MVVDVLESMKLLFFVELILVMDWKVLGLYFCDYIIWLVLLIWVIIVLLVLLVGLLKLLVIELSI